MMHGWQDDLDGSRAGDALDAHLAAAEVRVDGVLDHRSRVVDGVVAGVGGLATVGEELGGDGGEADECEEHDDAEADAEDDLRDPRHLVVLRRRAVGGLELEAVHVVDRDRVHLISYQHYQY